MPLDYLCERCGQPATAHGFSQTFKLARVTIGKLDGACDRTADEVNDRAWVPDPPPDIPPDVSPAAPGGA